MQIQRNKQDAVLVFSCIALMAAPVNHLGEAKSFDSFVAPNLEWLHLEVSQRSSSFSRQPINLPAPSFVDYLRRLFLMRL